MQELDIRRDCYSLGRGGLKNEHFGALYHRRWHVEEAFKRIKHRLDLEAVTSFTHMTLQQDFAAKVLTDNLCAALACADAPDTADSRPNPTR